MPLYTFECARCCDRVEVQLGFDDPRPQRHTCGGKLLISLGPVRTGNLSPETRRIDAKEAAWSRDMPAYKRLRRDGEQPPGIDGCARLEATAENTFEIQTGGRHKFPEERVREGMAMAAELGWSPVEQKRAQRAS